MKTAPGTVISRIDGEALSAEAVVCDHCGCMTFYVIGIIQGAERITHFQCSKCSEMYCCHEGVCSVQSEQGH